MSIRGIDVSSYQGKPNWSEVADSGVKFAILRIMNSKGKDISFEHNYAGCEAAGISRGVYRYSYALTTAQVRKEAQEVLQALAGRKLEMGVWLDLEWSRQRELGSTVVKEIANAWMKVIRDAGYECNVYCNRDWHMNVCGGLDAKYWIARYPSADNGTMKENLKPNLGEVGWQYSSKGRVPGISGNVDMDIWYGDINILPADEERIIEKEAVRSFQEAANADNIVDSAGNDLKVDGVKGKCTGEVIKKILLKSGAFDTGKGRFTVGSTGQLVKWLQMRLNTIIGNDIVNLLGHALDPDGKLGADTRLAVGLFQEMRGLKVDYLVGSATITELMYTV